MQVPPPLELDDSATPASRTMPPIRKKLVELLQVLNQPHNDPAAPWQLQYTPDAGRDQTAALLKAYLDAGVPPQGLTWQVAGSDSKT